MRLKSDQGLCDQPRKSRPKPCLRGYSQALQEVSKGMPLKSSGFPQVGEVLFHNLINHHVLRKTDSWQERP